MRDGDEIAGPVTDVGEKAQGSTQKASHSGHADDVAAEMLLSRGGGGCGDR